MIPGLTDCTFAVVVASVCLVGEYRFIVVDVGSYCGWSDDEV